MLGLWLLFTMLLIHTSLVVGDTESRLVDSEKEGGVCVVVVRRKVVLR